MARPTAASVNVRVDAQDLRISALETLVAELQSQLKARPASLPARQGPPRPANAAPKPMPGKSMTPNGVKCTKCSTKESEVRHGDSKLVRSCIVDGAEVPAV